MTPQQATTLIEWIYRDGFKPNEAESFALIKARRQIKEGKIHPDTAKNLQKIYARATGGGVQWKKYV